MLIAPEAPSALSQALPGGSCMKLSSQHTVRLNSFDSYTKEMVKINVSFIGVLNYSKILWRSLIAECRKILFTEGFVERSNLEDETKKE